MQTLTNYLNLFYIMNNMSYICEFCGIRPENCGCSIDLTEPRLESELVVADNIMATENPAIQRSYGLVDAPSPSDFFSLLIKLEESEKYDTPPSTPKSAINLPPPPKLERQTNRPLDLCVSDQDLKELNVELFTEELFTGETATTDADVSDIDSQYCENCYGFICDFNQENECFSPDQLAREAYEFARDCGTYDYYRFCRDFPDEEELIKCPTCEEMIHPDDQNGMCYACFALEQRLYPDDIAMDLRYNSDSF